ncbi:MAG: hypothetical protein KatS3mg031_1590 [Chitinophagales bacterium]|nr:MAG: hypothetical protein KatS3mg031_1590 [Chitinophagales bacterium]
MYFAGQFRLLMVKKHPKKSLAGTFPIVFAFVLLASSTLQAQKMEVQWKEGLRFTHTGEDNRQFTIGIGGRLHYDAAFIYMGNAIGNQIEDSVGNIRNGTEIRRARFYSSGTVYRLVEYKLQLDFAGGKVVFKDAFIAFCDRNHSIPLWKVYAGQFKEPFRLESLTSSNHMLFMERAVPADYSPDRNTGLMLTGELLPSKGNRNSYGRMGWQAAVFRNADVFGNDANAGEQFVVTARLTGLPVDDTTAKGTNIVLHLGAAFSYRYIAGDEYDIAHHPDAHLTEKYLTTGTLAQVNSVRLTGGEIALLAGRFSFQAEVVQACIQQIDRRDRYRFIAYYGQTGVFLTPDKHGYKSSYQGLARVKPAANLGEKSGGRRGAGAWEIALRYGESYLDNPNITGGTIRNLTAGLNWYLNPVTRLMINYVYCRLDSKIINGESFAHVVQTRLQVDF